MKKIKSTDQILAEHFSLAGKVVADVGCGTGELVRWLAGQGALVTGLDSPFMLAKARSAGRSGTERYVAATAEQLPFADASTDLLIYSASLHHVPAALLSRALGECRRALKSGGLAAFIEPLAQPGSYYDVAGLVEEESEARRLAYQAIQEAVTAGFAMIREEMYYYERSYADFQVMVKTFVADESLWPGFFLRAREVTEQQAAAAGVAFDAFRFPSICRLNILQKK